MKGAILELRDELGGIYYPAKRITEETFSVPALGSAVSNEYALSGRLLTMNLFWVSNISLTSVIQIKPVAGSQFYDYVINSGKQVVTRRIRVMGESVRVVFRNPTMTDATVNWFVGLEG